MKTELQKKTSKQSRKQARAPGFHETRIKICFFLFDRLPLFCCWLCLPDCYMCLPDIARSSTCFELFFSKPSKLLTRGDKPRSKHEDQSGGKKSFSIVVGLENCCNQSRRKKSAAVRAEEVFFNWNLMVEDFLSSIASGSLSARVVFQKISTISMRQVADVCKLSEKAILKYSFRLVVWLEKKRFHDSIVASWNWKPFRVIDSIAASSDWLWLIRTNQHANGRCSRSVGNKVV